MWKGNIKLSLFGESHGEAIGVVIDGLMPGTELDLKNIAGEMARRSPGRSELSTAREEDDMPKIISGFFEGKTTGTPLCALIYNRDKKSGDYSKLKDLMRPGHADYSGAMHYKGFNDYRGGGHFSGRLTAPLVFAGAICKQILEKKGIQIAAHILSIKDICDKSFDEVNIENMDCKQLKNSELPLLNIAQEKAMRQAIIDAKERQDSLGGVVECMIIGVHAGIGEPFFDSIESTLSHLLFSIPAVKAVEFGCGFEMSKMFGSQCNDAFYYDESGIVKTKTNHNGGILGGITTGMPIVFKAAVKPTPSIAKLQSTVNIKEQRGSILTITGRHDPCIVPRIVPVIEAAAAIAILDLMEE
jgi:chorismate synthase